MSDALKKVIPVYIILIIYVLFISFLKCSSTEALFLSVLNPLLLLIVSLIINFFTKEYHLRIRRKNKKFKTALFTIISFTFIYIFSGLIFGYIKKDGFDIVNVFLLFSLLLKEFIRFRVSSISKNRNNYIFLTLLMIILDIDLVLLFNNFSSYIFDSLILIVLINMISTYMCLKINLLSNMIFRCVIFLIGVMPYLPDLKYGFDSLLLLVFGFILFYSINRVNVLDDRKHKKRLLKRENPLVGYSFIGLAIFFLMFMVGFFRYQPIAILSDSMKDYYARGDVVIVEKISSKEIKNICENDILYFRYGNKYITHRVVDIQEDEDGLIFYTKGDNNDEIDSWTVSEDEIDGIVKFRIKYLGWPTIWVYELLS